MMVQKARLFNDEEVAKEMLQTTDPKTHKALGRRVRNFDSARWDESMLVCLFTKQKPQLRHEFETNADE